MTTRVPFLAVLLAAALGAGCGSTSTTSTAPATLPRCGVTLATTDLSVPASGGTGSLAISTARECAWTATSNAPWLSLRGVSSGQGDGSVEYAVSSNSEASTRRAVIELNDQKANVTQAAAECTMQLADTSEGFAPAGGSGTIAVRASSTSCPWTAVSDSSWIVIRSGASGTGNGTVTYDVAAAAGPPRTGTIVVAGLRFAITQSEGCTFAASPASYTPGQGGGSVTVNVTAGAACPWTAVSNVPWITVAQGASGTGPGAARLVVEPTSGPPRTGSALVAGQAVTVSQSSGCGFTVAPLAQSFEASGGSGTASIESSAGCEWNASTDVPWITFTGPTSGTGSGGIAFSVAAATGGARTGTITAAGSQIRVTQGSGCAFAIAPTSANLPAAGGTGSVAVTTAPDCAWTAVSGVSWLTVTSGASGSGNGTVQFSAEATSGGPRSGVLTIGGQTFTVAQDNGCAFSIAPTTASVAAGGGTGSVAVTAGAGCAWTASSGASWLTVTAGASGSGSGTVQYSAAGTSGGSRSGTLTIAGQTFTVEQGAGCSFAIAPTTASVPAAGGTGSVAVTAGAGCAWTASSGASWLTLTAGASGSGSGTVQYSAASTSGGARSGTLTIAGQAFTVEQGAGCSFAIAPASASVAAAGGTGSVAVTAGAGCAWTASSSAPWLTISAGASGSGNDTVQYSAAATTGGPRSATLTIGGQTFTVNQGSGCTFSIAPTSASAPAGGGTGSVAVTSAAGCGWTAASNAPWLTVTSGASGSGNGTVQYSAAATTGGARSGTLTIGGQTFTVNQGSGCSFSIAPTSANVVAGGGTASAAVTAGAGCAWTATSNAPWLTVTSGASGTSNGTVNITAAANPGAQRSGTLTIGGQTYTVNQAGGCTFGASPTTIAINALGGARSVAITAAAGCAWTASSAVNWITVSSGASGSGNGTVQLSIGVNIGGARDGTVTAAGQTVTINQAATLCTWSVNPGARSADKDGEADTFNVNAGGGCPWTATSNASWITITSGASGTGNGTVGYTVARNTTNETRSGTVSVAGVNFTVNQKK